MSRYCQSWLACPYWRMASQILSISDHYLDLDKTADVNLRPYEKYKAVLKIERKMFHRRIPQNFRQWLAKGRLYPENS